MNYRAGVGVGFDLGGGGSIPWTKAGGRRGVFSVERK